MLIQQAGHLDVIPRAVGSHLPFSCESCHPSGIPLRAFHTGPRPSPLEPGSEGNGGFVLSGRGAVFAKPPRVWEGRASTAADFHPAGPSKSVLTAKCKSKQRKASTELLGVGGRGWFGGPSEGGLLKSPLQGGPVSGGPRVNPQVLTGNGKVSRSRCLLPPARS